MKWLLGPLLLSVACLSMSQGEPEIVWSEGQGSLVVGGIYASPDGNYVAVSDWPLDIRRTSTLQQVKEVWPAKYGGPFAYSANSQWVLGCGWEGVRFFLPLLGIQTGVLNANLGGSDCVATTTYNGNQAFVSGGSNNLALWARVGGVWLLQYRWFPQTNWFGRALAISPDGTRVAVSTGNKEIRIFDLHNHSQTPVATLTMPSNVDHPRLKFSKNGEYLFALSGPLRIWRTSDWGFVRDIHPTSPYESFEPTLVPTELWVARGSSPGQITRINLEGTIVWSSVITPLTPGGLNQLPDGSLLFGGFRGISKLTTLKKVESAPGATDMIESIAASPNDQAVAVVGWDGHLRTFQKSSGLPIFSKVTNDSVTWIVRAVPDGLRWLVKDSDSSSNNIKAYDTNGTLVSPPVGVWGGAMDVMPTAHPTHGLIAAAGHNNSVRILRLSNYSFVGNLPTSSTVGKIVFSPDGSRMIVFDDLKLLRVYRTVDWSIEHETTLTYNPSEILIDSSATKMYVTRGSGIDVYKRTGTTWSTDGQFETGNFATAALSRDGRTLAIGTFERIDIYYLPTRTLIKTYTGPYLTAKRMHYSVKNDFLYFSVGSTLYTIKNPYPAFITSMTVSSTSIQPGQSSALTVTLTKPAPAGGLTIQLTDYTPNVWTPATLKIPAGQFSATTNLLTLPSSKAGTYTIVGTLFGVNASTRVTVAP